MIKLLFFDYREIERISAFRKVLEQPTKHPDNPLFVADAPWENGNMQLYGSVIKAAGRPFQMWYSLIREPWQLFLAYAESDDGIVWHRKLAHIYTHNGQKTNIIFTKNPHGPAVIFDEADTRPDWRYKMVAGADPSGCICAYRSGDGVHWHPVQPHPIIPTDPDCPMGFLRTPAGRYALYHRLHGYGRRVFRSESWDFTCWPGEPRMVMEPDASDPPQLEFYGMGSAPYGSYEIGTLWTFHTDPQEYGVGKMRGCQQAELTYARSGYAWHRAAAGTAFIPHGGPGAWDQGNLQCASQPVYLDDEIRYYYAGTNVLHKSHWELDPQRAGLGMASIKLDRFVALCAGEEEAELMTVAFTLPSRELFINASIAARGWVRVEMLDAEARPIQGLTAQQCQPVAGDSLSHPVRWRDAEGDAFPVGKPVRIRLLARHARLYSIWTPEPGESAVYHRFTAARP